MHREHRPPAPRHPHRAAALGQRPRGRRRRPARACSRTGRAPCPRSSGRSRTRAARAAVAHPIRAVRRPARCRNRRARPWPTRRRSWRAAPGPRPPTRTPRCGREPAARIVAASTVSRLACATKSVCTIAAACAGSFSARAWSPRMPNASTAVPIGPCSATIESTSAPCDARSSASNSRTCTAAAPAACTAATCSSSCVGAARGQHHRRAAGQPRRQLDPDLAATAEDHDEPGIRVLHGSDYRLR